MALVYGKETSNILSQFQSLSKVVPKFASTELIYQVINYTIILTTLVIVILIFSLCFEYSLLPCVLEFISD